MARRIRVPLGFATALVFFAFARPSPALLGISVLPVAAGIALRAYAAGFVRKNAELTCTGPYAYTRNPLYLGSFILGLGFSIASGHPLLWALFGALFLGIYWPVMRVEAATLAELFMIKWLHVHRQLSVYLRDKIRELGMYVLDCLRDQGEREPTCSSSPTTPVLFPPCPYPLSLSNLPS